MSPEMIRKYSARLISLEKRVSGEMTDDEIRELLGLRAWLDRLINKRTEHASLAVYEYTEGERDGR